jgi:hypothetical protein
MAQAIRLVRWPEIAAEYLEWEAALIPPSFDDGRKKLRLEMAEAVRESPNQNRCRIVDEVS